MAKVLSDTPEFVDGFVEACYNKGFSELQTAELLKTAARLELLEAKDEHFMAGMEKASSPYSGLVKALKMPWQIPVGPRGLLAGGAMAGGAALPAFTRPVPFDTDESALSGAGKGALVGGLSGLAMGALSVAGRRGAGGVSNLRRFFQEGNPFPGVKDPAGNIIPGARYTRLDAPFIAAGKAISNPASLKGLQRGVGYGAAAGLGVGLKDSVGGGGGFSGLNYGNYTPGSSGQASSTGGADKDQSSIYSVPRKLNDYYTPGASTSTAAAGVAGGAAVGALAEANNRVKAIENKINTMRAEVAKADRKNPNAVLRASDTEREIRRLMREKDIETRSMNRIAGQMSSEQAKYQSAASRDYELATRRYHDADKSFNRHMSRLNDNGWLAPLLATLFNSRERAGMQADNMNQYAAIRDRAQQAMNRSF